MYWRIKKISPEDLLKTYSVHAVALVSILFNLILFTRVSASHALSGSQKLDYDKFARQATMHLFDANYLTFEDSMKSVMTEFGPQALLRLKQDSTVPKDDEEMKAIARQLADSKSVSGVKFDEVTVGSQDSKGFLPVSVKARIVVHDMQGVRPSGVQLKYLVGTATNKQTNESHPIVVDLAAQFAQ